MSFKIIATRSRRDLEISVCPSTWEQDGRLLWPPKNINSLRADASSEPEDHWKQYDCEIKKAGIPTYKEALQWEAAFQAADTDGEAELSLPLTQRKRAKGAEKISLDIMMEDQHHLSNLRTATQSMPSPAQFQNQHHLSNLHTTIHQSMPSPTQLFQNQHHLQNPQSVIQSMPSPTEFQNQHHLSNLHTTIHQSMPSPTQLFQNQYHLQNPQSVIQSMQSPTEFQNIPQPDISNEALREEISAMRVQQNIQHSKVMTMLEKIFDVMKNNSSPFTSANQYVQIEATNETINKFSLPVTSINEVKLMDRELETNKEYFITMEKHFSAFVGSDGQARGEVVGKKMAEEIMSRDLMTQMSWTGASRSAGCPKKFAFQSLESISKLFYSVLIKADSRWTHKKNCQLFSGVLLKHANKRALAEKLKINNLIKRNRMVSSHGEFFDPNQMMEVVIVEEEVAEMNDSNSNELG